MSFVTFFSFSRWFTILMAFMANPARFPSGQYQRCQIKGDVLLFFSSFFVWILLVPRPVKKARLPIKKERTKSGGSGADKEDREGGISANPKGVTAHSRASSGGVKLKLTSYRSFPSAFTSFFFTR